MYYYGQLKVKINNSTAVFKTSLIETPRSRADEESDSVKDFFIVLFAYPEARPSRNALTGIQNSKVKHKNLWLSDTKHNLKSPYIF